MRLGVLFAVLLGSACATAPVPGPNVEPPAPSKVKTVPTGLEEAVKVLSGRFDTLQLKVVTRVEQPGSLLLVVTGPKERSAAVSSGAGGFSTSSFTFSRRYTLRFVAVDEGHTRIEASTTAEFEDPEVCNPMLERRDQLAISLPRWSSQCSFGTSDGRPNVDVVDSREQRWVTSMDEEPLAALLGE